MVQRKISGWMTIAEGLAEHHRLLELNIKVYDLTNYILDAITHRFYIWEYIWEDVTKNIYETLLHIGVYFADDI